MTTLHRRLLIALLVLGLGAYIEWRAGVGLTDFDDFHGAASRILETGSLSPPGKLMRYPPSFMILMWPLGLLPLSAAVAVFYLLSVAALLALPGELERLSGIPWRGQWPAWLVMLPLIVDNLVLGQSGPVLLYLVVAGTARSGAGRALAGGFLIGLAALWKVLPTLALAIPLLRRRVEGALAGLLLSVLALGLAGVLLVGPQELAAGVSRWLAYVQDSATHSALAEGTSVLRYNNQSLAMTLARTFGDVDHTHIKGAIPLANLPLDTIWIAAGAVTAGLAVLGLAAGFAARRVDTPRAWISLLGIVCIALLLPSPIVWTHYFIWLLPGLVAIADRRRLMLVGGSIFVVGLAVQPARSLGLHLVASLALYVLLSIDLIRQARPAARAPHARHPRPARPAAAVTGATGTPPMP